MIILLSTSVLGVLFAFYFNFLNVSVLFGKIEDLYFGKEATVIKSHFYKLVDRDVDGKEISMSKFAGKVLLAVNVASK